MLQKTENIDFYNEHNLYSRRYVILPFVLTVDSDGESDRTLREQIITHGAHQPHVVFIMVAAALSRVVVHFFFGSLAQSA